MTMFNFFSLIIYLLILVKYAHVVIKLLRDPCRIGAVI